MLLTRSLRISSLARCANFSFRSFPTLNSVMDSPSVSSHRGCSFQVDLLKSFVSIACRAKILSCLYMCWIGSVLNHGTTTVECSLRWRLLLTRNNYRSAVMLSLSGMAEFSVPHHDLQFAHLKCGHCLCGRKWVPNSVHIWSYVDGNPKFWNLTGCSILKSYICISEKLKRNFLWVINFLPYHQSLKQSCKNRSSDIQ